MEQLENTISPHLAYQALQLNLEFPASFPKEMKQALNRTVLKGGKRLRPILIYLMGELFNIPQKELEIFARAIELVHSASLSHDDVIDSATERRSNPSINAVLGNKKSILAGDYLLGEVLVDICATKNLVLVQELSRVIQDLALGEWLQMDLGNKNPLANKDIEEVALKKTASVMSWCCIVPAFLAKVPKEIIENSRNLGKHFGLAFQLIDDLVDFMPKASGKDYLADLQSGTINNVLFELLNNNMINLKNIPKTPWWTQKQLEKAMSNTYEKAQNKIDLAKQELEQIESFFSFIGKKENKAAPQIRSLLNQLLNRYKVS